MKAWVAISGGQAVGYASATKELSTWQAREYLHLDCLFVVEACRNQGIGERLLSTVREAATAAGMTEMRWYTPQRNKDAIRFYLRTGARKHQKTRLVLSLENT